MQNKGLDEFIIGVANNVKDEIIEERIDIYSDEVFSFSVFISPISFLLLIMI